MMFTTGIRPFEVSHAPWPALAALTALAALVVACGGQASSSAAGSAGTSSAGTSPAATSAGPTTFAAWTERQGFGGSSGVANVTKLVRWVKDHPGEATTWDLADDTRDINVLAVWLDTHPATSCWTEYHAAIRASLATIAAEYAQAQIAVEGSGGVPSTLADQMVADADKADKLPIPSNCP